MPWIRLVWRPSIDDAIRNGSALWCPIKSDLSARPGIQDLEDLVGKLIVLINDDDDFRVSDNSPPHMHLYRAWLHHHAKCHPTVKSRCRDHNHTTVAQLVSNTEFPDSVDMQLASRLALNVKEIFAGQVDSLAVMLEEDLLYKFYEDSIVSDSMNHKLQAAAQLLAHNNANMKILEIGAGTGGATSHVLQGFRQVGGTAKYHSYTFTDISPWFFDKAKRRFAGVERVEFKTLDIEKSPVEQGFTEKYDLIIASNVSDARSQRLRPTHILNRFSMQHRTWKIPCETFVAC